MVPKQRKSGQFGGDGHRSNKRAARAAGGKVQKPSPFPCLVLVLAAAAVPVGLVAAVDYII